MLPSSSCHPNNDEHARACPPQAYWTTASDVPRSEVFGQVGMYLILEEDPIILHNGCSSTGYEQAQRGIYSHILPWLDNDWFLKFC